VLRYDLSVLQDNYDAVRNDISTLKEDNAVLKDGNEALRRDVSHLSETVDVLKKESEVCRAIRNRFLDFFQRDYLGKSIPEIRSIIQTNNKFAHDPLIIIYPRRDQP
jgi:hypothetical protein